MKDNSETATLREGNKPKAEKVRELKLEGGDEAIKAAEKQNQSEVSDGTRVLNQIPNSGKSVVVSGCDK